MDHISNMLALILLGYRDRKVFICVYRSNFCLKILEMFYIEGIISGFSCSKKEKKIIIFLRYIEKKPLVKGFKRISSQRKQVFSSNKKIIKNFSNKGLFLISNNQFKLQFSSFFIKNQWNCNIGGEVLFRVLLNEKA